MALAFIDVKKVYNRVCQNSMWATLEKWGYRGKALRVIQGLYTDVNTKSRQGSIETESIELRVGLKQGCVRSPLLFSLYLMELGYRLESSGNVRGRSIPALFFAEDMY